MRRRGTARVEGYALLAALRDPEWAVRSAVVRALGQLGNGTPTVLDALLGALHDPKAQVREAAAQALRQLDSGTPAVLDALLGALRDPDWTVRDVVAHLGTWLAETQVQFERMSAGTYEGHDIDIDALNARFLAAMAGQPWEVAWVQANAARTRMLEEWFRLREPSDEAAWWIRKGAAHHYDEHLPRLREWAGELLARRGDRPTTVGA